MANKTYQWYADNIDAGLVSMLGSLLIIPINDLQEKTILIIWT